MDRRERNKKSAQQTMDILEKGLYQTSRGKNIVIRKHLEEAVKQSCMYTPEMTDVLLKEIDPKKDSATVITVTNETTLEAAKRLKEEGLKVVLLNFASAKNPGGGFLKGSMAQEESLALASGLYPCINQMTEMYEYNKEQVKTCLYSDYMVYSPLVPVFKNDQGQLLDRFYTVSMITSPAVNAGVVRKQESKENQNLIHSTMETRIEKILALGIHYGYEAIVLGAYGCGVFKNDPKDVADYFRKLLHENEKYRNHYKKVVFAVLDREKGTPVYYTFKNRLEKK